MPHISKEESDRIISEKTSFFTMLRGSYSLLKRKYLRERNSPINKKKQIDIISDFNETTRNK